jgi:ADP-L-glycero-D-manno-heptose 6-epimerase
MLLVTGGAGFIGSNVAASLNEVGRVDIAVNDILGSDGKWRNLAGRQLAEFVPPADLWRWLDGRKLDAVVHLGAISSTTATDADLVIETNFRLSLRLLEWCAATRTPFIYASSAATYGDGAAGFSDDGSLAAVGTCNVPRRSALGGGYSTDWPNADVAFAEPRSFPLSSTPSI